MQAIISFFAQFDSVVTTKVFIDNGQECFALISKHDQKYNTPYKFYRGDLASSAINFIYDDCTMGRVLHTFQDSSSTQKLEMDSKNVLHWKPLWQLAEWLYQSTNLHPYYYSLLSAIINLYNQGMRNEAPTPFESSALVHTAEALLHLYETVRQFLDTCTRTDNCEQAILSHLEDARLRHPEIRSIGSELIPSEADHNKHLVPALVLHPQTALDIWYYFLPRYYDAGVIFRRCENCGKCFVTTGVGNPKYCDRIVDGTNKTCKQLVAKEKAHTKNTTNPINILFNRTYKTMYSRVSAGTLDKEKFQQWANAARQVRKKCESGLITIDDFSDWLQHSRQSPRYK